MHQHTLQSEHSSYWGSIVNRKCSTEGQTHLCIPLWPVSAWPTRRVLMEDSGEPLRKLWPSSAPPLLLRAGVPGPPLPWLLLEGLTCRPRRASALTNKRSLQRLAHPLQR